MSTYTKEQVSEMLAALVYDIAVDPESDDESELDPYVDVYAKRSADDGVLEIIAVTKSFIRRGVVLSPPARHVGSVRSLDSESEIDRRRSRALNPMETTRPNSNRLASALSSVTQAGTSK